MTVIGLVSKITHFILIHIMVSIEEVARLFLHNMQKLHNISMYIISDYRSQFVVFLMKELYCLLLYINLNTSDLFDYITNNTYLAFDLL